MQKISLQALPTTSPGMLPGFRVKRSSPFANTGVDFAGPLYIKDEKSIRNAYIALFTCSVTRAIRLELVEDLSAPTFLQALKRFSSRMGIPSFMISDNAKTFKATAKWLKKLFATPKVRRYLQETRVNWRFHLELAPWWGGFFERLVGVKCKENTQKSTWKRPTESPRAGNCFH